MHSISDLTTFYRKTTGDVPDKLVGASTTVVGTKMYLFGGRLFTERRMVSDLYMFDLISYHWEKLIPYADDDVPKARYFHSADAWNNHLVIFGGMSNKFDAENSEDLCVLNDVRFFDIATRRWLSPSSNGIVSDHASDVLVPRARYAHLSSITSDRLFIIGGQDLYNVWLDDVYVYDLLRRTWVQRRDYPRHCGTYRSVAVSANMRIRLPQQEPQYIRTPQSLGPPGARFQPNNPRSMPEFTPPGSLVHLPYSAPPTDDHPCDIYLYSNYNFTDVKRELEVFSPLPDSNFTIQDRSSSMTGSSLPPGLRFPSGAVLGTHFIVAGTYLAHTYQSYSIWALDLLTMTWSRIDPGSAVATGSWFRGCLWAEYNKFMIFGNRNANLVDDYNRRLLSWSHIAVVDLESFGIYQPPPLRMDIPMQQLGLSALEESVLTDFVIMCDDGRKVNCSRKVLEERWPWFKDQLRRFHLKADLILQSLPASPTNVPLPSLPGVSIRDGMRPDPRLTPRSFHLSESYPITLALLQYFYSLSLITPLQHAPPVLSQLLVLSSTYGITHLESLVKHAMHRALSNSTSVGVYEVATLCSCRSLQIRALKTVMSYSQRRPGRSRQDREDGSGGHRPPDTNGTGRNYPGGSGSEGFSSRPRGTSDASRSLAGNNSVPGSSRYLARTDIRVKGELSSSPVEVPARSKYFSSKIFSPGRFSLQRHPRPFSGSSSTHSSPSTWTTSPAISSRDLQNDNLDGVPGSIRSTAFSDGLKLHDDISVDTPNTSPSSNLQLDTPYPPQSPPRLSSNCSESDESDCPRTPISSSFPAFHLPRSFSQRVSSQIHSKPDLTQSQPWINFPAASLSLLDFPSIAALTIDEEHLPEDDKMSHWSLSSGISSILAALYNPPMRPTISEPELTLHGGKTESSIQHESSAAAVVLKSTVPFPVESQDPNDQTSSFPSKRKRESSKARNGKKVLIKRRSIGSISHRVDEKSLEPDERKRKRSEPARKPSLRHIIPQVLAGS